MSHTLGPLRPCMPNCPLGPWSPCIKQQIQIISIFSQLNKLNSHLSPYKLKHPTECTCINGILAVYFARSIMFTDFSDQNHNLLSFTKVLIFVQCTTLQTPECRLYLDPNGTPVSLDSTQVSLFTVGHRQQEWQQQSEYNITYQ